jgi:hypothetical protein
MVHVPASAHGLRVWPDVPADRGPLSPLVTAGSRK